MVNLITKEYQDLLQEMHKKDAGWAKSGTRFLDRVTTLIQIFEPQSILDYGCGKGALASALNKEFPNIPISLYDPGIPQFSTEPPECDMVICTDVLEHVEPAFIGKVLDHISKKTKQIAYFIVHTGDCGHKLPDGRPAHILQREQVWWEEEIVEVYRPLGFEIVFKKTGLPYRFEAVAVKDI